MPLRIRHNLSRHELVRAMAALADCDDVAEELSDALAKAGPLRLPDEPYLLGMFKSLESKYLRAVEAIGASLAAWFDAAFRSPKPWRIFKALPGAQLTQQQIAELSSLIQAHFRPAGMSFHEETWRIPQELWSRWQALGIVPEGMHVPEFGDAYVSGRLYQVIAEGDTYEDMRRLARAIPMTRPMRIAADWASSHAAQGIARFGQRLGQQAADGALAVNQRIARGLVEAYMRGDLKTTRPADGPAADLTPEERASLETDKVVDSWRGLARELYKTFRGTESQRDWARVAVSETRLAYNVGRVDAIRHQGAKVMWFRVRPDACVYCRRVYLDDGGKPKVFPVSEVSRNIDRTGGMNVGRKASLIGEPGGWIATALLHPWCRCLPVAGLPE